MVGDGKSVANRSGGRLVSCDESRASGRNAVPGGHGSAKVPGCGGGVGGAFWAGGARFCADGQSLSPGALAEDPERRAFVLKLKHQLLTI